MNGDGQQITDDVSRGVGLLHLRLRTQLQSVVRIFLASLLGIVTGPILTLWFGAEANAFKGASWWWVAKQIVASGYPDKILHPLGDPRLWTAASIVDNIWFSDCAKAIWTLVMHGLLYGVLASPFLGVALVFGAKAIGRSARRSHLLRGREQVRDQALADLVVRRRMASDLSIGTVPLVAGKETQHTLMLGTVGAGKSQAMFGLLDRIRKRGDLAIIYDIAGSFTPLYYHPEWGDQIVNPLDVRGARWSPWAEIDRAPDCDRVAASLIPAADGPNRFFSDAARAAVSAALQVMMDDPHRSVFEMVRLLVLAGSAEKFTRLRGTEAQKFYDPEAGRTGANIDATLASYVRSLRFLSADAGRDDFSIGRFVRSADAAPAGQMERPWLFISSRRREHEALRPLITAQLDAAIAAALSLEERLGRRIWLFLDELDSLQQVPSLSAALQEGRKFGICVVAGLQDLNQLLDVYGKERGEALIGLFNTKAIFRLNSKFSADYASWLLGEEEKQFTEESGRYGAQVGFESLNIGTRRDTARLVLPTEIMDLPDLECFVKLPGAFPVGRTKLPNPAHLRREKRHPAFLEDDLSNSVGTRLRLAAVTGSGAAAADESSADAAAPSRLPDDDRTSAVAANETDAARDFRRDDPSRLQTINPALDVTTQVVEPHHEH